MFSKFYKKFLLIVCAFVFVFSISCKEEKSDKSTTENLGTFKETVDDTQNNSTNNSEEIVINPAHGQPGHRCDIEVGQPLPSGSSSTGSPVINTSPKSPVINNNATTNVNPPHGQPGHKCEIPVGAPLN